MHTALSRTMIAILTLSAISAFAAKPAQSTGAASAAPPVDPVMQQFCIEQAKHEALKLGDLSSQVMGNDDDKSIAKEVFKMNYMQCMEKK